MKPIYEKNNKLHQALVDWKERQAIKSIELDDFVEFNDDEVGLIIAEKIDGELNWCEFDGSDSRFCTLDGHISIGLPVLTEITKRLKQKQFSQASIVGTVVSFDTTLMDGEEQFVFVPVDLFSLDGVKTQPTEYLDKFKKLHAWFKGSALVKPTRFTIGGIDRLEQVWDNWVLDDDNEGVIIRVASDCSIWKIKSSWTFDLVVIAVEKSSAENTDLMGALHLAFMDRDSIFRYSSKVASGFSDFDRKAWWDWALQNKVDGPELGLSTIWVVPQRIVEVHWKRADIDFEPAFVFDQKQWSEYETELPSAAMTKPIFVQARNDKGISPENLRLIQIPNWEEAEKHLLNENALQLRLDAVIRELGVGRPYEDLIEEFLEADWGTRLDARTFADELSWAIRSAPSGDERKRLEELKKRFDKKLTTLVVATNEEEEEMEYVEYAEKRTLLYSITQQHWSEIWLCFKRPGMMGELLILRTTDQFRHWLEKQLSDDTIYEKLLNIYDQYLPAPLEEFVYPDDTVVESWIDIMTDFIVEEVDAEKEKL